MGSRPCCSLAVSSTSEKQAPERLSLSPQRPHGFQTLPGSRHSRAALPGSLAKPSPALQGEHLIFPRNLLEMDGSQSYTFNSAVTLTSDSKVLTESGQRIRIFRVAPDDRAEGPCVQSAGVGQACCCRRSPGPHPEASFLFSCSRYGWSIEILVELASHSR